MIIKSGIGIAALATLGALMSQMGDANAACNTGQRTVLASLNVVCCSVSGNTQACGAVQKDVGGVTGSARRVVADRKAAASPFAQTTCFVNGSPTGIVQDTTADGVAKVTIFPAGSGCANSTLYQVNAG
jgi:hypothetical protein